MIFDAVSAYFAGLAELKHLADDVAVGLRPFQRARVDAVPALYVYPHDATHQPSEAMRRLRELAAARGVFDDACEAYPENVDLQLELLGQVDEVAAPLEIDVAWIDEVDVVRIVHERDACARRPRPDWCSVCRRLFAGDWFMLAEERRREVRDARRPMPPAGWGDRIAAIGTRDGIIAALLSDVPGLVAVSVDDQTNDVSVPPFTVRVTCVVDSGSRMAPSLDLIERGVRECLYDNLAAGVGIHELRFLDEERRVIRSRSGESEQTVGVQ